MKVYFMRAADGTGPIKIGVSRDVEARRLSLGKAVGKEMAVLACADATHGAESIIQRGFNSLLIRGVVTGGDREWFEPAPELMVYIAGIACVGTLPSPLIAANTNEMLAARKALNLTQAKMAKALKMSQSAISKMENGTLKIERRTSLALDALKAKKEGKT